MQACIYIEYRHLFSNIILNWSVLTGDGYFGQEGGQYILGGAQRRAGPARREHGRVQGGAVRREGAGHVQDHRHAVPEGLFDSSIAFINC